VYRGRDAAYGSSIFPGYTFDTAFGDCRLLGIEYNVFWRVVFAQFGEENVELFDPFVCGCFDLFERSSVVEELVIGFEFLDFDFS
jgi:hypothetical protein